MRPLKKKGIGASSSALSAKYIPQLIHFCLNTATILSQVLILIIRWGKSRTGKILSSQVDSNQSLVLHEKKQR